MTADPVGPDTTEAARGDGFALHGRITTASNATFLGELDGRQVVYKPIDGEKPLWDFPDRTLANREVAAYRVSEAFGWHIVPRTWLGSGPFGAGMLQEWQDIDAEQDPVDLVPEAELDDAWRPVLEASDERDRPVVLAHEDSVALRRMAVFDVVVNNADRKGAHVLAMPDGHRYGVDHGLTFHVEHKLRTVLWGWIDEPLTDDELAGLDRVIAALDAELGAALDELLTVDERDAFAARCAALRAVARFPAPHGYMPAVPWPLF
jgi:uncharacterized repeat protein (TIGR03843 family)